MFAFLLAALTAVAIATLTVPLLARKRPLAGRLEHDLAVYRDQLAEIGCDQERGVLDAGQAEGARLEVQRRMLAAARQGEPSAPVRGGPSNRLVIGVVGALP